MGNPFPRRAVGCSLCCHTKSDNLTKGSLVRALWNLAASMKYSISPQQVLQDSLFLSDEFLWVPVVVELLSSLKAFLTPSLGVSVPGTTSLHLELALGTRTLKSVDYSLYRLYFLLFHITMFCSCCSLYVTQGRVEYAFLSVFLGFCWQSLKNEKSFQKFKWNFHILSIFSIALFTMYETDLGLRCN